MGTTKSTDKQEADILFQKQYCEGSTEDSGMPFPNVHQAALKKDLKCSTVVRNRGFKVIDLDTWSRQEHFEHYLKQVPCTYQMTVKLDISGVMARKERLYPSMLHVFATVMNRHEELRCFVRDQGQLCVWEQLHPSYTVFHQDSETFSILWTAYEQDYARFKQNYEQDLALYGANTGLMGKPDCPENCFNVSMIPWVSFDSFTLDLPEGNNYLLPIFTMGRFYEEQNRTLLPVAIRFHHAVCDGFHAARLVNEVQELLNQHFLRTE